MQTGEKLPLALVIGAGPVGMTLATGLAKRGYDVCLVERSKKAFHFDTKSTDWSKSYSYRIDIRGQTVLNEMGLLETVTNTAVPIKGMPYLAVDCCKVRRGRAAADGVAFCDSSIVGDGMGLWITRPLLRKVLYTEGMQPLIDAGKIKVVVTDGEDKDWRKSAEVAEVLDKHEGGTYVVFGCDGVHSVVRDEVMKLSPAFDVVLKNKDGDAEVETVTSTMQPRPEMITIPCASTGLRVKIVPLDCETAVRKYLTASKEPKDRQKHGATDVDDGSENQEAFPDRFKPAWVFSGTNGRTLPAFSAPDPKVRPFSSNNDPILNSAKTVDEFYAYLEKYFPMCEGCGSSGSGSSEDRKSFWRACISESAAKEFVESTGSVFSPVQYSSVAAMVAPKVFQKTSASGNPSASTYLPATAAQPLGACLLGDSLHGFPPDLGQGVNCGLKDVGHFLECLDGSWNAKHGDGQKHGYDTTAALVKYNAIATKEARALCELSGYYGAPYTYGQPLSFGKVWSWAVIVVRMVLWAVGLRKDPIGPLMLTTEIKKEAEEVENPVDGDETESERPRKSSLPGYYSYAEIVERQKWF